MKFKIPIELQKISEINLELIDFYANGSLRICNFRVFGIDYGENISIGMQDFDFYCSWARLDDY